jgi:hypothetical protein
MTNNRKKNSMLLACASNVLSNQPCDFELDELKMNHECVFTACCSQEISAPVLIDQSWLYALTAN